MPDRPWQHRHRQTPRKEAAERVKSRTLNAVLIIRFHTLCKDIS